MPDFFSRTSPRLANQLICRNSALSAVLCFATTCNAAITLSPHDVFATDYDSTYITQYDDDGKIVGSINLRREARGIAFGPDELLYVTTRPERYGFEVLAVRRWGAVEATYRNDLVYLGGYIGAGKIAVDYSNIYVAGGNVLTRFRIGDPDSGETIYSGSQVRDVEVLPSGNLLVASRYTIRELTPDGKYIRDIEPTSRHYSGVNGVEFDPVTKKIFVTQLGYTGFTHRIMRIDFATGMLEADAVFDSPGDIFLSDNGNLVVGSRNQSPGWFSPDLEYLGSVGTTNQMFVAQYVTVVPEPVFSGLPILLLVGRRRGSR